MATLTLRSAKGSPLTNNEVDANFTNLNTDKYESGNNATFGTIAGTTVSVTSVTTTGALSVGGSSTLSPSATVGTITHTGYKTFAVKVVPLSSTTSKVPFFKDLRAIALQV